MNSSLYLKFEEDYSQLHIIGIADNSNNGPIQLFHNNVLVGIFKKITDSESFTKALGFNYVYTTFGARYVFSFVPTDIYDDQTITKFSDGVWHVKFTNINSLIAGTIKFDCLWCALSKMLNNSCTISGINDVNEIKAWMTVAEGNVRHNNIIKAVKSYNSAKTLSDPYKCSC